MMQIKGPQHWRECLGTLLALGLLVSACADDGLVDNRLLPMPAQMDIVSGDAQQGEPGQMLPEPLVVRVLDETGVPIKGQIINFLVTGGGGSVFAGTSLTNAEGVAQERWTLGTDTTQAQSMEARAVDSESGERIVFATFAAQFSTASDTTALQVSNLAVASGKTYQVVPDGLKVGVVRFTDRDYTVASPVPTEVEGLTFIRTANDDKSASVGSNSFLSFDVNQDVTVYVAHDDRLTRPSWLEGWTDTGLELKDSEAVSTFSLFQKAFAAGTVTLGSNTASADGASSMYTVVVQGSGSGGTGGGETSDTEAPSVPTGLTATAVSSSRIDLSWTASTDNVGVSGYKVYREGTQIATTSTTSYSDTGLAASTTYSYTVAASDAAGNTSSQSAPVSATTQESSSGGSASSAMLYGVWELSVVNTKSYSNPFDYQVIELQAVYTAPSGRKISFFGFHDGDGQGGQVGNVWKLRFMPDEVGDWSYSYTWTDGTAGGSGTFSVTDTGRRGPLRIASDRSWFFEDAREQPFHFRGYDLHGLRPNFATRDFEAELAGIQSVVQSEVITPGYNFTMLDGLINRWGSNSDANTWTTSWWEANQYKRFDVSAWAAWEEVLDQLHQNDVYVIPFAGMIYQGQQYAFTDFQVFLRYWLARFAPYSNWLGWSPTWEWYDIWGEASINEVMQYLYDHDPWKRPLSAHDKNPALGTWTRFTMRQYQQRTVTKANRTSTGGETGSHQIPAADQTLPILGSEDHWEMESGNYGNPRNAAEVRRGVWGNLLAGVMPLYSDWHYWPPPSSGAGVGEPEVLRMFDFVYANTTTYRQWVQKNSLVGGADQRASGITDQEYIVYDESGGEITLDLSEASAATSFSVTWFNPATGASQSASAVSGGASHTLTSPYTGDSVLLLRR